MTGRIFGLAICPQDAHQIADEVVAGPPPSDGAALIVTPNIQHASLLRSDPDFRAAYGFADKVVCDGFPVHYYAKIRGCPSPGRVTGCDIAEFILRRPSFSAQHRFYFVLDQARTVAGVHDWAHYLGMAGNIACEVPEFGFENDPAACRAMAERIKAHGTTILFMGVGAPKSEVFVHRQRDILPRCWALCVGQGVKIALGMTPKPPSLLKTINLEWLWRIILEPRRMAARYGASSVGFLRAVIWDLLQGPQTEPAAAMAVAPSSRQAQAALPQSQDAEAMKELV